MLSLTIPGNNRIAWGARIAGACLLCAGCACFAAAGQTPAGPALGTQQAHRGETPLPGNGPAASHDPADIAATPAEPAALPPPAPVPARVVLNAGRLTVDANDSDLGSILKDVAASSGMTIEGLDKSARVFGHYGPGTPCDVLTELLDGTGYNFVMVGGANGQAPRQLVLSAQSHSSQHAHAAAASADEDDDDSSDGGYQQPLGPGAIENVPPQPSSDEQERMQQHMENLQRMRQILEQQQQQQQENGPQ